MDARGFAPKQTISQQINIGNVRIHGTGPPTAVCSPKSTNNGTFYQDTRSHAWYVCQNGWRPSTYNGNGQVWSSLLLSTACQYEVTIADPRAYAILQHGGTSIMGNSVGGGANGCRIYAAGPSTSVYALYGTPIAPEGGGSYIRASGFALDNTNHGTLVKGVFDAEELFDESVVAYVMGTNPYGDAAFVNKVCCGSAFEHVQFVSAYGAGGGVPLTVTNSAAVEFRSSTFNAAGTGMPNIRFGAGNTKITFENVYAETNGDRADVTTPVVQLTIDSIYAYPIFIGGAVDMNSAKPCFNLPDSPQLVNLGFCRSSVNTFLNLSTRATTPASTFTPYNGALSNGSTVIRFVPAFISTPPTCLFQDTDKTLAIRAETTRTQVVVSGTGNDHYAGACFGGR